MIQNIYINFLPGSAGNFLSRILQLAITNSCCWLDQNETIPNSATKKFLILSYDKNKQFDVWQNFEKKIKHFSQVENFLKPANFVFISISHLYSINDIDLTNAVLIQIDIKNKKMFEWVMMNGLFKDVKLKQNFYKVHTFNKTNNKNLIEVDIESFLTWETFKVELENLMHTLNIETSKTNWKLVEVLYMQWWETTLKFEDFESYKRDIGWLL